MTASPDWILGGIPIRSLPESSQPSQGKSFPVLAVQVSKSESKKMAACEGLGIVNVNMRNSRVSWTKVTTVIFQFHCPYAHNIVPHIHVVSASVDCL